MGAFHSIDIPLARIRAAAGEVQTMAIGSSSVLFGDQLSARTRIRMRLLHVYVINDPGVADFAMGVRCGQGYAGAGSPILGFDEKDDASFRPLDRAGRFPNLTHVYYNVLGNASFQALSGTSSTKPIFGIARNRRPLTVQWSRRDGPLFPILDFGRALCVWLYPQSGAYAPPIRVGGYVRFEEIQY